MQGHRHDDGRPARRATSQRHQATISSLDEELSSGEALQKPSDNPVAVADTLGYSRQIAQAAADQANATTAQSWLGLGNDTANSVDLDAADGADDRPPGPQLRLEQRPDLRRDGPAGAGRRSPRWSVFANTQLGTTPIFAGTAGVAQPYSSTGVYSGNSQSFTISVGNGAPVAVSVPGDQMFGGGTSGMQSVFTTLQNIVTDLQAGTGRRLVRGSRRPTSATSTPTSPSARRQRRRSASRPTRSPQPRRRPQNTSTQLQTILSTTEDADIPTVTAQLQSDLTTLPGRALRRLPDRAGDARSVPQLDATEGRY